MLISCVATSINVEFEVLRALVTQNVVFWNITPCWPLKVSRRFGGTFRLHFQALLDSSFYAGFSLGVFFNPEYEGDMFLRKVD
jgi:hypothetical protein